MLQIKNVCKSYKTDVYSQKVLDNVNINFRNNEFVCILGPSGSGKTTLLNIIGGLDKADSGDLIINGKSTKKFKNKDFDSYRNNCIGFIFQNYNLISHMSILNNVRLCLTLAGIPSKKSIKMAKEALENVGLKEHLNKKPNELSGGQMQRVSISRAIVNNPDIILADEPTGALDSKTSIQIMELLKEISKNKLVIMVTHNSELAYKYSNRIININDGKIIDDTNPFDAKEDDKIYKINKTSMNFFTALKLSFNNILTKKGRTFLISLAASIGIMGIAVILALSNGFKIQIDKFEKNALSQVPIVIEEKYTSTINDSLTKNDEQLKDYTSKNEIYYNNSESNIHTNNITNEYINYLNDLDDDLISGISYQRLTNLNLLVKINGTIKNLQSNSILFPMPNTKNGEMCQVVKDNFELIYGNYSKGKEELLLLVDEKNTVDENILNELGYNREDNISFDDIIGKEFKVILNDDYYIENNTFFTINNDYESLYNNKDAITLKISGIIRGKEDSEFAKMSGTGILYNESLMTYVIEKNKDSKIVNAQKQKDYNVLTLEKFDLNTNEGINSKNNILSYLADDTVPSAIQIYPSNFDSKKEILEYLDKYNDKKSDDDKIIYIDQSELITSLSSSIMDAITTILVAFSAISLIVSTIMIGIIIYISVLERTKEIGILRSIGARKKDITRVFNAETFIIGLISGIIGILGAKLLSLPINIIIKNLSGLSNVSKLSTFHAIILILISITLTIIGGLIPSTMASKKDPVKSLRID